MLLLLLLLSIIISITLLILIRAVFKIHIKIKNARLVNDGAIISKNKRDQDICEARDMIKAAGSELPTEDILKLSATNLWEAMHNSTLPKHKQLKCKTIMLTYINKAIDVQTKLTCLAQVRFKDALLDACRVDERIAERRNNSSSSIPGVLEGIPLSIKDAYDQEGFDNTCGLAARCCKPLQKNGLLVDLLCDAGAIPFCRTATPQSLLLPESISAAWGRTSNPHNKNRTSGGSSGGEAALLASLGSPLGIGSDIGGSIRNPAHFCGLFAFKPTPQRLSLKGAGDPNYKSETGQNSIRAVCGPMGHCVKDLVMVLKAWFCERMWKDDCTIPRIIFDEQFILTSSPQSQQPLRIGYYTNDGYFTASPSCVRAVKDVVDRLTKSGYICVPFQPPLVTEAVGVYYEIMSADDYSGIVAGFEGEYPLQEYSTFLALATLPRWITWFISCFISTVMRDKRLAQLVHWCRTNKSVSELYRAHIQQARCRDAYIDQMDSCGIDVVIGPGHALPAFQHGASQDLTPSCSYNFLYNVIGFPAGSVPVTRVRSNEMYYEDSIYPDDAFTRAAKKVCTESQNLPIGVQVVARPFKDEYVLKVMKVIENIL